MEHTILTAHHIALGITVVALAIAIVLAIPKARPSKNERKEQWAYYLTKKGHKRKIVRVLCPTSMGRVRVDQDGVIVRRQAYRLIPLEP